MCRKGFTLAELLIALLILGVIATFTIPKVLQTQIDSQKKSTFRETLAMMHDIIYQGTLTKEMTRTNPDTYLMSRINAIKQCPVASGAQGCWTHFEDKLACPQGLSQPGVILSNGAIITGLDDPGATGEFMFTIDWNGAEGPNQQGDDQLWLRTNYDIEGWPVMAIGQIKGNPPCANVANETLFNWIWSN